MQPESVESLVALDEGAMVTAVEGEGGAADAAALCSRGAEDAQGSTLPHGFVPLVRRGPSDSMQDAQELAAARTPTPTPAPIPTPTLHRIPPVTEPAAEP